MPTAAREYVSTLGLGDAAACHQVMQEYVAAVRDLNTVVPVKRASAFARILFADEDAEDELLEPDNVALVTNTVYPCLWVNLTFEPTRVTAEELAVIESRFALQLIGTASSKANLF